MAHYDYIIIGAGASGLMLADALGKDAFFSDKSILLLDKDAKKTNDRTWCFWEVGKGQFDDIVSQRWKHIYFGGQNFSDCFDITPYTYKMVRGADFYASHLKRISTYPNISFRQEEVSKVEDLGHQVHITTDTGDYSADKVFSSLFEYSMVTRQKKYPVLQQHFIGWTVKTKHPVFNPDQVVYMDFSIPQKGNTRFMYVLPFSETEALVEYTLFSESLLAKEEYENAIKKYLEGLLHDRYSKTLKSLKPDDKIEVARKKASKDNSEFSPGKTESKTLTGSTTREKTKTEQHTDDYEILDTEQGSIPMTCYDFSEHHTSNIRYIGTAGGWAKPSTGYTFMSTSKKVPVLVKYLKTGKPLNKLSFKNKFWYYDLLLLDVLAKNNGLGHQIFETLFKNRDPQLIFQFLDEKTPLIKDLQVIVGCPPGPFMRALFKRMVW